MKVRFVIFFLSFASISFSQSRETVSKLYLPDSTDFYFSNHNDLLKSTRLENLIFGADSIELRLWKSTLGTVDELYVLKNNNNQWSANLIQHGTVIKRRIYFGIKISERKVPFLAKIELEPVDSWEKIENGLSKYRIPELRNQSKLDSARNYNIDDGITYTIEYGSKNEYRFVTWTNPKHAPKRYWDSEAVIWLSELFEKELKEKEL